MSALQAFPARTTIFLLLCAFLLSGCGEKFGPKYEGWACAPTPAKGEFGIRNATECAAGVKPEYYYDTFVTLAARGLKPGEADNRANRKRACIRNARKEVNEIPAKILGEHLKRIGVTRRYDVTANLRFDAAAEKLYAKGGITYCCDYNYRTDKCNPPAKGNWQDCKCWGFAYFPGGREAYERLYHKFGKARQQELLRQKKGREKRVKN